MFKRSKERFRKFVKKLRELVPRQKTPELDELRAKYNELRDSVEELKKVQYEQVQEVLRKSLSLGDRGRYNN